MYKCMLLIFNVSLYGSTMVYEPYKIHTSHKIAHDGSIKQEVSSGRLSMQSLHEVDKYGNTPLHYAAFYNCKNNVETLLACGVDINVRNNLLETPLFHAVRKDNQGVIMCLVSRGAAIHINNIDGKCLCSIATKSQMEIMETINLLK